LIRFVPAIILTLALVGCGATDSADAPGTPPVPAARKAVKALNAGGPPRTFGPLLVTPGGFDLGTVAPNSAHEVDMTLANTGREPITIVMVSSDCKCTVPEALDGTVIAPGESVPMTATFTTRSAPGPRDGKVVLNYKVGTQRMQRGLIKIGGEVALTVRSTPAYVDALKGATSGTVGVAAVDGRPFRIVTANGEPPNFTDGFDPGRDEPRTSYTLGWNVNYPPTTEDCTGNEPLWWVVETDHPDCPVLPLRIRNECTGMLTDMAIEQRGWMFYVYMVNAGAVTAGTSVDLDVDLRRLNELPSTGINAVESLTRDATAEFLGILEPPGEPSTVRFRFTPGAETSGLMYAMVNFKSLTGDKEIAVIARVMP